MQTLFDRFMRWLFATLGVVGVIVATFFHPIGGGALVVVAIIGLLVFKKAGIQTRFPKRDKP